MSPIAIAFNVEGVDALSLDPATIAGIFAGTITNWNDPAIAATNDGVTLPDLAITPVHRSDKSGTTANFTDYLAQTAADVWTYGSVEEWPIQAGEAAQGTSGVVNAIKGGNGTIGYADHSQTTGLSVVSVQVGSEWVEPSAEGAAIALDASPLEEGRETTDLAFAIDRTTEESGAYPVLLVSYLIGCVEYADADDGGSREGLLHDRRQRGRPAGRGRRRRQRADLAGARRAVAGSDRPDQVSRCASAPDEDRTSSGADTLE